MKENLHFNIDDTQKILTLAKALSSEQRLSILRLLDREILNISEIAARLSIPMSTAALHVRVLEEAELVITQPVPGNRGLQKQTTSRVKSLAIDIMPSYRAESLYQTAYFSIPIGNYFDFQVTAPCGIATDTTFLSAVDNISSFYQPEHAKAQLIWFTTGYLEYRIDAASVWKAREVERVEFSFEACSEAEGYNNDWPSDITLSINGVEVGTFTSPGDFGGERGKQNPIWWPDALTQYGQLHTLSICRDGCYLDGVKSSDENLHSLWTRSEGAIFLRIGVKPDAANAGGLNLFGERFGNYSQHINVKVNYIPG